MALLDEATWRGRVYSGGWVTAAGGDAAVTEKATGAEIEQWSIRESGKIGPAAQFETHLVTSELYEAATLPSRPYGELIPSESPRLSFIERIPRFPLCRQSL
jgi:hypothetical protein